MDTKSLFEAGQLGKDEVPAADWEGVLGGELARLYWVLRRSKSSLVVTVLPSVEILTIPNWPAALAAGK